MSLEPFIYYCASFCVGCWVMMILIIWRDIENKGAWPAHLLMFVFAPIILPGCLLWGIALAIRDFRRRGMDR